MVLINIQYILQSNRAITPTKVCIVVIYSFISGTVHIRIQPKVQLKI